MIAAGCSPPGVARLAGRVFDAGLAHTVLAVPLGHPERRLDTVYTMLSGDTVLMRPPAAYSLTARVLTPGLDRLRVVETGFGPGRREQWDDAGNSLVLAPGLLVLRERNVTTLARLERCGVEVIAVPGGELCGRRAYATNSKVALRVAAWLPGARRGKVPLVELNVSSRFHDDHTIVTIRGEIDLYTAPRLHSELGAVLVDGTPTRVVIDMSGVEFCDSTGMNVLLSCLRRVRERGGELEIASPKPAVRKILQVTGLDSVFTLVDDSALSQPKPAIPQ